MERVKLLGREWWVTIRPMIDPSKPYWGWCLTYGVSQIRNEQVYIPSEAEAIADLEAFLKEHGGEVIE